MSVQGLAGLRAESAIWGAVAFPLAYVAVGAVRRYALRRRVLDMPNDRSSHCTPTPRGGGLGLIAAAVLGGGAAVLAAGVPAPAVGAAAVAVVLVAAIGWLDDHEPLRVRTRLGVHLTAGAITAALATWPSGLMGGAPSTLLALAVALAWWVFWTVAAINVVNFIDGIDGLIGSQMGIYGIYVALLAPRGGAAAPAGLAFAAAAAGFLLWNWAPARIFLGDVGSGACGVFAVLLGLALYRESGYSLARSYYPLAPIFLDATVTLVRRTWTGERITTPHRSHLYQRLANGGWGHARTAQAFAAASIVGAVVGLATPEAWLPLTSLFYLGSLVGIGRRTAAGLTSAT